MNTTSHPVAELDSSTLAGAYVTALLHANIGCKVVPTQRGTFLILTGKAETKLVPAALKDCGLKERPSIYS